MLPTRFFDKIRRNATSGCWEWTAATASGYGVYLHNGKTVYAHRLVYSVFCGDPAGLLVCHSCDSPRCVHPAHLFLGTPADNARDAVVKGRTMCGEWNNNSRLRASEVEDIRRRLKTGELQAAIAADFGVNQATISSIATGKSWKAGTIVSM